MSLLWLRKWSVAVIAAMVLMPSIAAAKSSPPKGKPKLDTVLKKAVENSKDRVPVIIQVVPGGENGVRGRLAAQGRKITGEFANIGAVGAKVNRAELAALVADPAVAHVSLDVQVHGHALTAPGPDALMTLDLVRADLGSGSKGVTGNGVGIAIIDSGINGGIPDIAKQVAAFYDFTQGGKAVASYDDYGHGTHIAATIASSGQQNFYLYTGIAPKARLIGLKVLDKNGAGSTSAVIAALQFATNNKAALGIDIVNLSLGHPIYESAATDPLVLAVEAAVRRGIVVVVSAGNHGTNATTGEVGYGGITSPGNAPSAITVGAANTSATLNRSDDFVAPYSSRGPSWIDGYAKPTSLRRATESSRTSTTRRRCTSTTPLGRSRHRWSEASTSA
jgi:serine protease AprX